MVWLKLVQRGVILVLVLFLLVSPTLFFMLKDHMNENPERWKRIKGISTTLREKASGRNTEDVVEVPEWSLNLHDAPYHAEPGVLTDNTDMQRAAGVSAALQKSRRIRREIGRIVLDVNSNSTRGPALALGTDKVIEAGFSGEGTGETADLAPSLDERLSEVRAAIRRSGGMKQQKKAAQPEPGVNILPDSKPAPKPQQAAAQDDTARNLAMSTSVGVHDSNLAVFLGSLRAVAPQCTILLFTPPGPPTPHMQELLSKYSVRTVQVPAEQKSEVWGLYHVFLRDKLPDFDAVLVASAADTAFQSSPFAIVQDPAIYISEEGPLLRDWGNDVLKSCFSEAVAAEIGEKKALWSESIVGRAAAMAGFLKDLQTLQQEATFGKCAPDLRTQGKDPDRAAVNVVLHRMAGALSIQGQQDGPMALLDLKMAKVNADGKSVTNKNTGRDPPVIHQYHLDKALIASLIARHVPFHLAEDKDGAGQCAGYKLLSDVDAFAGFGDMGAGPEPASSLDACCQVCTTKKTGGCKAFTFLPKPKQCWLKSNNIPNRNGPPIPEAVSAWVPG